MKHLISATITLLFSWGNINSQNLISNPSFEEVNKATKRWSGTHAHFNDNIKYWDSPTQGSPDLLFVNYLDEMYPKRPNVVLSSHAPRTGNFMIGIKTYGCQSNTLHCKEYLQIKLNKPLSANEKYYYEYWVAPIKTSVKVNSFGIAANKGRMQEYMQTGLIDLNPVSINNELIEFDYGKWQRVSGEFISDDNYDYIIIGNFGTDQSIAMKPELNGIDYGYYLLDDVFIKHLPANPAQKLAINEIIILENILFEFDQVAIQDPSKIQLDELVEYLNSNKNYHLEIMGHTDPVGTAAYNLKLSQGRADSIKDYLTEKGIEEFRIKPIGLGSEQPIASNDSEANRKINRRVEIKIVESQK